MYYQIKQAKKRITRSKHAIEKANKRKLELKEEMKEYMTLKDVEKDVWKDSEFKKKEYIQIQEMKNK